MKNDSESKEWCAMGVKRKSLKLKVVRIITALSITLCKWENRIQIFILYLDSVFKYKHKLVHNQSPVMNRLCPLFLNLP